MTTAALVAWPFVGRHAELERIDGAVADDRVKAVLITGRPGVGKTRLAEEGLRVARARDLPTAYVSASGIAATVPLSALAPILPPHVERHDPYALFATVRDHLATAYRGERLVLAVDDVQLLDATSEALLAFLLAEDAVFVIAAIGAGAPPPEPLDALWRAGRALRLDLAEFDRRGVDTLLHLTLAGPVTAPATQAMWDYSRGNVLYLRELVALAREEGTLRRDGGIWSLRHRMSPGAGLAALVERRLRDLPAADRRALDLLAACGPLGVEDVADEVPDARLARLEALELIVLRTDGQRSEIALAHPLHARVLRAALPRLLARELLQNEIARVRRHGARRRGDALRLAGWLLDATGTADPELLTQAATIAWLVRDGERARHLAEAALRHGPNARASLVAAEVRADDGDRGAAEALLADAFADSIAALGPRAPCADVEALVEVAVARATNLHFGLCRPADARAVVGTAAHAVAKATGHAEATAFDFAAAAGPITGTPGEPVAILTATDALLVASAGRPLDALALLGDAGPEPGDGRVHVLWLLARSVADVARGGEGAADRCRAAYAAHVALESRAGLPHPAVHLAHLAEARLAAGALHDAAALAEQSQMDAAADGAGALAVAFMCLRGRIDLARGRPASAATHFRSGLAEARRNPNGVAADLAPLAGLLQATAVAGEVDPDALAAAGPVSGADRLATALAWVDACDGEVSAAGDRLVAVAAAHQDAGRLGPEAEALHDLVRLGRGTDVADRLAAVAAATGSPFDVARARHARAAADRDAAVLHEVAAEFAGMGASLIAAETYAQAAAVWLATGQPRPAARATALADELAGGCEGARTPALVSPTSVSQLSAREREVALLAARGVPSKDIAEMLFLSVRTVNNHLQSVYGKLGVSARGELAAALGTLGASKEVRQP